MLFDTNGYGLPDAPRTIQRFAYDANDKIEYQGYALPGTSEAAAGWLIVKFAYDGDLLVGFSFAGGRDTFGAVWEDYADYTYA